MPRFALRHRSAVVALAAVVVGIVSGVLYARLISGLALRSFHGNDRIFGADTQDNAQSLQSVTLDGDMRKHLLFSPIMYSLNRAVARVSGKSGEASIIVTFAVVAGLNFALAFVILARALERLVAAFLVTAIYAATFANLLLFSVPETYALANLGILLFCLQLDRCVTTPTRLRWAGLGLTCGVAGLVNLPLLSLVLPAFVTFLPRHRLRGAAARAALVAVIAVALVVVVNVALVGADFYLHLQRYGQSYGSFGNLTSLVNLWRTLAAFLFYSVVRGVAHFDGFLTMNSLGLIALRDLPARLTALAYLALLSHAVVLAVVRASASALAWLSWILAMVVFYTWFNPQEAMLYTTQSLFPLILIVSVELGRRRYRFELAVLALFLGLLLWHNLRILEWA